MKKAMTRILTLMMILALLMLPSAALAQDQTQPEAFALTVDDFRLEIAGAEPMDIGLAFEVTGGLNQAGDRGLWALDITSANMQALSLTAALEDGAVKAHLTNALGELPYLLKSPLEALAGMAGQLSQATGAVPVEGTEQFTALFESCAKLAESVKDPAQKAELNVKVRAALDKAFQLNPAGEENIELFGVSRTAQKLTGKTDFAGFLAALPEIFAADPNLKACYDGFVRILDESGMLGEDVTFAGLPRQLAKEGGDFQIDVTEYKAGEEQLRLDLVMNALQNGKQVGLIGITVDSDTAAGRPAFSLTLRAEDFPGSSGDEPDFKILARLEALSVLTPGSEESHLSLGLSNEASEKTGFAFKVDTRKTDATAQNRGTCKMSLSAEYQAPSQVDSFAAAISYDGENYETDGFPLSEGGISVEFAQGGTDLVKLSFSTLLKQMDLPEGELLKAGELTVLDITNMTEEQNTAFTEAFNIFLNNSLGLLFQDPGLAALLGGAMQ